MPTVRVSRGWFDASQYDLVRDRLAAGENILVPAISRLPGLLHYYVGIDDRTNSMINVSVWESDEAASAMSTLKEMLAQRDEFTAIGVRFDSLANYAPIWDIAG